MRCMTSLPGASWGWALPATTIWTGSASSRSRSEKTSPARLYVAKRRANPIVRRPASAPLRRASRFLSSACTFQSASGSSSRTASQSPVGRRCVGANAGRAQELVELRREPRAEVHAVRDVADRGLRVRPEPGPHLPGNRPVQRRDPVRMRGEPERQRRQAETVGAGRCARARAGPRPRCRPALRGRPHSGARARRRTPRCPPGPAYGS